MTDQDPNSAGSEAEDASGSQTALEAGIAHHSAGDLAGAKAAYEAVLEAEPENGEAHHLLGLIAFQTGDPATATEHLQRALAAQPDNPQYHLNFAETLRAQGETAGAIAAYRRATAINPEFFEAFTNLGLLAMENEYVGEGIEALRRAVAIQPTNPSAQSNLGVALREVGEHDGALEAFARALAIAPEQPGFRQNFDELLKSGSFITVPEAVRRAIENAFLREGPDHQALVNAGVALVKRTEAFQGLLAMAEEENVDALASAVSGGVFDGFMSNLLVRSLLTRTIVADVDFERVLTRLRRVILEGGVAPQPVEATVGRHPQFVAALAMQAYNVQYAWRETPDEGAIAGMLLKDIRRAFDQLDPQAMAADTAFWSIILVAACYRPLGDIDGAEKLLQTDVAGLPAFVMGVVGQQVADQMLEADIADNIETITDVKSETSAAVQEQYETRPYPRWLTVAVKQPATLGDIIRAQSPWRQAPAFAEGPINALVAGCGTGKHAIDVATQYPDSKVLGIDLSKPSLAYAWRMAMEMQLTNVRFAQGDIAGLGNHAERYHLIESVGVLHHMADPVAGWKILVDLLEPRGIMKIGLYSETARQGIQAAREVIAESGVAKEAAKGDIFGADAIRKARQVVLDLEPDHPARSVVHSRDFYSLSGCRDLLFPSQETAFTIPSIAAALGQLGLEFMSFHISDPQMIGRYLELFPDSENLADLDKWQEVERQHPNSFFGMYQFWCQKRD